MPLEPNVIPRRIVQSTRLPQEPGLAYNNWERCAFGDNMRFGASERTRNPFTHPLFCREITRQTTLPAPDARSPLGPTIGVYRNGASAMGFR